MAATPGFSSSGSSSIAGLQVEDWPEAPPSGTIHVWMAEGVTHAQLDDCLGLLSPGEQERAGNYRFDPDRRRFTGSRLLVRHVFAHYLHCEPRELSFESNQWGKPVLGARFASPLFFSLSRSDDLALLAVSSAGELGVDVEKRDEARAAELIAKRQFSMPEQEFVARAADRTSAFFEIWTRKEAYVKGLGVGLSHPLGKFSVAPEDGAATTKVIDWTAHDPDADWHVRSLTLPRPGYAAALATPCPAGPVQMVPLKITELLSRRSGE